MPIRVLFEFFLAPDGPVYFCVRNFALLGKSASQNSDVSSVKKVQDAIIDSSVLRPQFVNSVPKNVCQRSPELKAEFGEPVDSLSAFCPRFALAPSQQLV
jgi:hypothetical protein